MRRNLLRIRAEVNGNRWENLEEEQDGAAPENRRVNNL